MSRVNNRRALAVGALLFLASFLAACGGVKNPEGWASPTVDGTTIYYFPAKNRISSLSLSADGSASRTWNFPDKQKTDQKDLKFEAVYDDPAFDGGSLYFASWDSRLFALSARDGALKWARKAKLDGGVVGGPALAGDTLVFGTTSGRLYAVKTSDGQPAPGWPADGADLKDAIWAPPVVKADGAGGYTVYVATMAGTLQAYSVKDGSALWAVPFKTEGAIAELALLDDTHLFVPSLDKTVTIIDTADGHVVGKRFTTDDWVWSRAAFKDNVAYFGDFSGKVYALDITTGTMPPDWKAPYDAKAKIKSAPVIIDGVVVLATREPVIHFIDAKSGRGLNTVPLKDSGTVRAGLTVEGGRPLIATTQGKLFVADPKAFKVEQLVIAGEKP